MWFIDMIRQNSLFYEFFLSGIKILVISLYLSQAISNRRQFASSSHVVSITRNNANRHGMIFKDYGLQKHQLALERLHFLWYSTLCLEVSLVACPISTQLMSQSSLHALLRVPISTVFTVGKVFTHIKGNIISALILLFCFWILCFSTFIYHWLSNCRRLLIACDISKLKIKLFCKSLLFCTRDTFK